MNKFKLRYISVSLFLILLLTITAVNAHEDNCTITTNQDKLNLEINDNNNLEVSSTDLENSIINAENDDIITINNGTYYLHGISITKNITIQGNGNPRDIIIDGENKSSIFLIRNDSLHVSFKNITFINGLTDNFGGAISIETGHVYVDNCIFANNTALNNTNAGAISNYGNATHKAYLFVNNSLFINNHADHDGGAVTTCYANSDIYNSVFINNSAHRDGGAIRVSVQGYGHVEDCIFMYNHADEWGGAYYSWSGTSNINRCIFMNNTGGTNGGAVMVSGDLTLENSIIVNNTGEKTGGSFYIQEPMYQAETHINVKNNLITNNSSPKGQEIFIKWRHAENLYPDFNDNDWGDENPNDSKINDPNNVTNRIKVSTTKKSNLLDELNFNLLNRYSDLIDNYFPENYLNNIKKQAEERSSNSQNKESPNTSEADSNNKEMKVNEDTANKKNGSITSANVNKNNYLTGDNTVIANSTSSYGDDSKKAWELNETQSVAKTMSPKVIYFVAIILFIMIVLVIGYRKEKSKDK